MERKISALFHLRKDKQTNENLFPIYLRVTIEGKRLEWSTQRYIEESKWSVQSGRVKGQTEEARTVNKYLEVLMHKVFVYQKELMLEEKEISLTTFRNKWLGIVENQKMILDVFRQHNIRMGKLVTAKEYAKGTLVHFETSLQHLKTFVQWKFRQADVDIKKINYEFLSEFEFYLKVEKKLGHNSTMKYLGDFKKIVLLCVKYEWLHHDPFKDYKLARVEVTKVFLSEEEVEAITAKKFISERLEVVRDAFLFSCYTGLAYADVKKLQQSEIQKGPDGHKWLIIQRQKSGTPAHIPLLPPAIEIIERYSNNPRCMDRGCVLPIMSNQKMNEYLKEIAELSGITKTLTYHLARHTFATAITLNNDVPIESVSKMLGHKTIKQTQHYAKVLNKKVGKDMDILRNKYNNNLPVHDLALHVNQPF